MKTRLIVLFVAVAVLGGCKSVVVRHDVPVYVVEEHHVHHLPPAPPHGPVRQQVIVQQHVHVNNQVHESHKESKPSLPPSRRHAETPPLHHKPEGRHEPAPGHRPSHPSKPGSSPGHTGKPLPVPLEGREPRGPESPRKPVPDQHAKPPVKTGPHVTPPGKHERSALIAAEPKPKGKSS